MKLLVLSMLLSQALYADQCFLSKDSEISEYYCLTKEQAKPWFPRGNRGYIGQTFIENKGNYPGLECKVFERVDLKGVELCMRVKDLKYGGYLFARCVAFDWLETAFTQMRENKIMMDLTAFWWRGFIIQQNRNDDSFTYIFRGEGKSFGCRNLKPTPVI